VYIYIYISRKNRKNFTIIYLKQRKILSQRVINYFNFYIDNHVHVDWNSFNSKFILIVFRQISLSYAIDKI